VAATVNGQPILEVAVVRGLKRVPPSKQAEARAEILNYLIDNVLLDQYLLQLPVEVGKKDLEERFAQIRTEITKGGQPLEKVLEQMMLTEEELRSQLSAELRWEKFCKSQISDKELQDYFTKNLDMFDGSMVRARHILLTPPAGDGQAAEQARQQLDRLRQQIENEVAKQVAKVPDGTDKLTIEKTRTRALEDSFGAMARKESACPSKEQGGDLGWFPRAGSMVEAFSQAAFALKPHQLSDVVTTQFGCHLILVTDRRDGKETKFEDVREVVRDVFCERLREALCAKLKPSAKIEVKDAPK
jgi:peptidyl-prolyl cis-trans isomerase C